MTGLQDLHQEEVVHFDLKCDNILMEPKVGVAEQELFQPSTSKLPWMLALADFGESCDFKQSDNKFSSRWACVNRQDTVHKIIG